MAETRIRLYKYLTPPKTAGATISVGNKTIAGANFASTIKAVNSLGATVNSIGLALLKQQKLQQDQQKQAIRQQQLAADKAREGKIEAGSSQAAATVGNIVSGTKGFLGGLLDFFKKLLIFGGLDWLSDPKNREKIENVVNGMKKFFTWMKDTFTNISQWIGTSWKQAFGSEKTFSDRLKGATKLLAAAGVALLGLSFLSNPAGTIKGFTSIIGMVGKGILNLGKFLGGNVAGQALMAGAIGFRSYQVTLDDDTIPEEDRQAAAIGAGVGAGGGAMLLSTIGNQIAGPIGGMIGSALGGFLGKEAGKFLGPIVEDFFKTMKKIFDTVMKFLEKFFKPLGDAIRDLFKEMGPVIQKAVDFIKPHMPTLLKVTEFLGKVAFAPLIMLLKGLTNVLKFVGGADVSEAAKGIVGGAVNAVTGATPAAAGELPAGMASGDLASFIGAVESGNDYTKLVGGKRDPSILKKTVSQLNQEKGGQFAMGRYQIQMRTASEVLRNAGKDPSTFVFDKSGQDFIYDLLLKRRGLNDFKSGKISKERFAKNLSMEWAALPAGAHNRSYYAGDGKNKAHRTWADTLSVLERTKGRSKGGWISGPQSGYPVSLTGKSIDFIGHGTEYVAQRSGGGFVIPFDTPHTRRDPGLTARRIEEARAGGYLKSIGGLLPSLGLSSVLGMAGKVAGSMIGGVMSQQPSMPSYASTAMASMNNTVNTSIQSANTSSQALNGILTRIKQISAEVESGDLKNLIDMAVAQAIQLPVDTKPAAAPSVPIPLPAKENPATSFLTSRFGRTAELSNVLSNFF